MFGLGCRARQVDGGAAMEQDALDAASAVMPNGAGVRPFRCAYECGDANDVDVGGLNWAG